MFEMFLQSAPVGNSFFPDSGPGTKYLKHGDETIGWFGEVSATELFTTPAFRREVNFFAGNDDTTQPTWVKMFLDGKVIFFPRVPFIVSVDWNTLYNNGMVYGVDGNGVMPTATPTNQLKYVQKGNSLLKVRLFKAALADPRNHSGGAENISSTYLDLLNAEWGRIRSAILAPKPTGYNGPAWPLYTGASFLLPSIPAIAQTTRLNGATAALTLLNNTASITLKTSPSAWMPVLELVTDPVYFPIQTMIGLPQDNLLPLQLESVVGEDYMLAYKGLTAKVILPKAIAHTEETLDPIFTIDRSLMQARNTLPRAIIISSVEYE